MDSVETTMAPAWLVEAVRAVREEEAAARAQREAEARAAAEQEATMRAQCQTWMARDLNALGIPAQPDACEWIAEDDGGEVPRLRLVYRCDDYTFVAILDARTSDGVLERYYGVALARRCARCGLLEQPWWGLQSRLELGRAVLAAAVPWRCPACEDGPGGADAEPSLIYLSEADLVRDAQEAYAREREQQARAEAAAAAAVAAQRRERLAQALARVWGYRPQVTSDCIVIGDVPITVDPISQRLVAIRPCAACGEDTHTGGLDSLAALGRVLAGEATYYHDEHICPAVRPVADRSHSEIQRFARALRAALAAWVADEDEEA